MFPHLSHQFSVLNSMILTGFPPMPTFSSMFPSIQQQLLQKNGKKSKILNQLNKFFLHLTNVLGSRPKLQTKVICQTQMVGTKSFTKSYLSCDVFFQYFVNDVYLLTLEGLGLNRLKYINWGRSETFPRLRSLRQVRDIIAHVFKIFC